MCHNYPMRFHSWITVVFVLCAGSGASALADTFYVEDPAITGSYQDEATAFYELVRTSVLKDGKHEVVEDPKDAEFVLRPKLLKLGAAYSAAIEKVKGGKTVFASQHKARSVEELDDVAHRLVRSAISGIPVKDDVQVDDVTEDEAVRGTRRREVVNRRFIGFGPAFLSDNIDDSSDPRVSFEAGYGWDLNVALLKLFTNWAFAGELPASFLSAGLEADYFFNKTDIAPFAGVRLGYGGAIPRGGEFTGGFIGGAAAGLVMFRTSRINLEVAFRMNTVMHEVGGSLPTVYGLSVGLHY